MEIQRRTRCFAEPWVRSGCRGCRTVAVASHGLKIENGRIGGRPDQTGAHRRREPEYLRVLVGEDTEDVASEARLARNRAMYNLRLLRAAHRGLRRLAEYLDQPG